MICGPVTQDVVLPEACSSSYVIAVPDNYNLISNPDVSSLISSSVRHSGGGGGVLCFSAVTFKTTPAVSPIVRMGKEIGDWCFQ